MSVAVTQFTIADLERMPDDGMHREVLDGELIELPPPKFNHSSVASTIAESLMMYVRHERRLKVLVEAGYKLTPDERHWLQPDVSLLDRARAAATPEDGYFEGAPDVAIEVISPSERAGDVLAKTQAYLRAGTRVVVNVYPKHRRITVHFPDGSARTLEDGNVLTLSDVLSDWTLSLPEIFG